MDGTSAKSGPTWTDVKAKLANVDRKGLLALVGDLYAASKENQKFLHARFGLGGDALQFYKETIERWVSPDVFRRQHTSVVKAKKAISDYRKAVGEPAGLAELMVFYCERAAGFCREYGEGESYHTSLINVFEQSLVAINKLPRDKRDGLIGRLIEVRKIGAGLGYLAGTDMADSLARHIDPDEAGG